MELPIKILSSQSFEIIWNPEIDCVFELANQNHFILKNYPRMDEPFAKYVAQDEIIVVECYCSELIKEYSKQELAELFTRKYSRLESY